MTTLRDLAVAVRMRADVPNEWASDDDVIKLIRRAMGDQWELSKAREEKVIDGAARLLRELIEGPRA